MALDAAGSVAGLAQRLVDCGEATSPAAAAAALTVSTAELRTVAAFMNAHHLADVFAMMRGSGEGLGGCEIMEEEGEEEAGEL